VASHPASIKRSPEFQRRKLCRVVALFVEAVDLLTAERAPPLQQELDRMSDPTEE